jgi:hypothetical protein
VEKQACSPDTAPRADAQPALPPYPLSRGDVGFWLRRGEQLGRAACWIAATVAAGGRRAAPWRRHGANQHPIDTPPQPG